MAEVFSIVSAGVSLPAATGQLIDGIMKLHSFCSKVRDIPEDIQTAVDDLSTMVEVLEFVQVEISHEPSNPASSMKVLSTLRQSSQQVEEILEEMQIKLGKKKYWGRIKAVGMTKKLEKAAKRVENAQRMVLILLAAENRMSFRQSFIAQRRELTAISTRILAIPSAEQSAGNASRQSHAVHDIERSNTTDEGPDTAGPVSRNPIRRISRGRGRNITNMEVRLPSFFFHSFWQFSVYKTNQGWDFSLRSYNIRPLKAPIFNAICDGDLSQVRELLHTGRASIWDRDILGRGLLHIAALSCREHGSTILEYLVENGADIYDVDSDGFPPYFLLKHKWLGHTDRQTDLRLVAGYNVFMSHRNWIAPRPHTEVPFDNREVPSDIIDMFPIYSDPPEEISRSILHGMWPPWKDILPADRVKILFPNFHANTRLGGNTNPLTIRIFLSRESIQKTFANWDTRAKTELIEYTVDALSRCLALGLEKEIEEARLFLTDINMANGPINTLPEVDLLHFFVQRFASHDVWERRRSWPPNPESYVKALRKGLSHYITELMILGIDMTTEIDKEREVFARQKEIGARRRFLFHHMSYRVIAIEPGSTADGWYLWLSNPLDEWAGEFWDMVDHPEWAMPGAWNED